MLSAGGSIARGAALTLAVLAIAPALARGDPRLEVPAGALRASLHCPRQFAHAGANQPAGRNRPARRNQRAHRNPVLLVHGTGLNAGESWDWNYELALPRAGYDWCAVTLPGRALGDIQVSAEYVVYAIERIHALTHRKLTVITHSQGGMEGRWAMRWFSGARSDTAELIDLASPNHGINIADACVATGNCWPAVWQMASGSRFLRALNSVAETPGRVAYTQIYSRTDEIVEPATTVPLSGDSNTANIAIQAICPGRVVHHAGLLSDQVVWELVLDAMTHPGRPANPGRIGHGACRKATMPYVSAPAVAVGDAFLYGNAVAAFADHPGVLAEPPLARYARRYG